MFLQLGVLQCLASSSRVARCFPPCRGLSFDSTLSLRRFPFSSPFLRLFFAFSSPHLRLIFALQSQRHTPATFSSLPFVTTQSLPKHKLVSPVGCVPHTRPSNCPAHPLASPPIRPETPASAPRLPPSRVAVNVCSLTQKAHPSEEIFSPPVQKVNNFVYLCSLNVLHP